MGNNIDNQTFTRLIQEELDHRLHCPDCNPDTAVVMYQQCSCNAEPDIVHNRCSKCGMPYERRAE